MKKRDLIFLIVVAAVFGVFYLISGDVKTARVPYDDIHKKYLEVNATNQAALRSSPKITNPVIAV